MSVGVRYWLASRADESEGPSFVFLAGRASAVERGIRARHLSIQILTSAIWESFSCTWDAALKQPFTHFQLRCQRQHMFGMGADPAWSMKTCHLSFGFVSKRSFCGLVTASAAFEAAEHQVLLHSSVDEPAQAASGRWVGACELAKSRDRRAHCLRQESMPIVQHSG